eukprot:CAMPEP_0183713916 /NCGR_PEP_ID=MMETSP0737-20130205/8647_1 /TAXON_ID=385413 /ORGANISM="Thalassiosira miniscula, Strain CCMP1093" /LENGTH=1134 /DNA_ID=CAMNT_0025942795 /DNA_START=109 /DNA_END=3513 /DNA_ORIENTATION=+
MPPKKRKAAATSSGDDGIATPTPKKSKKEALAEARARAKAWHDHRNAATTTAAASATKSATATKSKASSSSTPAAKSVEASAASPPRSTASAAGAKRRRAATSRKSTGGVVASRTSASSPTLATKSRRASAGTATKSAPSFEFAPPAQTKVKEEKEESSSSERDDDKEEEEPPAKAKAKFEFGSGMKADSQEGEKKSAAKRKREEGLAKIRALREDREKQGRKVIHGHHKQPSTAATPGRKSPPEEIKRSPDPPDGVAASVEARAPAAAAAAKSKSPDPPAGAAAAAKPAQSIFYASAHYSRTTKAESKSSASAASVHFKPGARPNAKKPPASVAGLFSTTKQRKFLAAHRPHKRKYDPNQPWPDAGYKLPTAAYCGCGPTPGTKTGSVRGSIGGGGVNGINDLCVVNLSNDRSGSFTNADLRKDMKDLAPVGYGKLSTRFGASCENLTNLIESAMKPASKPEAKPEPPGRRDGEEMEVDSSKEADVIMEEEKVDLGSLPAAVPAAASYNPIPKAAATAVAPATPNAPAGFLSAAISRANALVSSAAGSNRIRRERMGIRSDGNPPIVQSGSEAQTDTKTLGLPPRGILRTEGQMDEDLANELDESQTAATVEGLKSPVDPPVSSEVASTSYTKTLQKFREADGTNSKPSGANVKLEEKEEDDATSTTVAGEHTSEVGENEEVKIAPNQDVVETQTKPPSALKRGCLAIGKLIMFIQLAVGAIYVMYNYSPYDWNDLALLSAKLTPVTDNVETTLEEESESPCFINYPDWDTVEEDLDNDYYTCDGNMKQCPPWGRCHAGKLLDCADGGSFSDMALFVPSGNGTVCVPSLEAMEYAQVVKDVLMDMTARQSCGMWEGSKDPEAAVLVQNQQVEGPYPQFSLDKVAERVKHALPVEKAGMISTEFMLWLRPVFDTNMVRFDTLPSEDDEVNVVGLGPGVSASALSLPFDCTLKIMLWEILGYFTQSAWVLATFFFKKGWFVVTNYPLYTMGAFVLWKLIALIRHKRKHRAKVRELFATVLPAVYDRLSECEDREGYAELFLRDDVGHELYPTNYRERQFLNDYVWPRVKLEIRADNRVLKFHKMTSGKNLEHWDFAIQSKRGWRKRKSLGTPSSTGRTDVKDGAVTLAPTMKREP